MTVTLVLRLVDEALASGELRGEVEEVRSGERRHVRDGVELLAFALSISSARAVDSSARAYDATAERGRRGA